MFARSGLITAIVEITNAGVTVIAPVCFDEETVVETGSFFIATQDVEQALEDVYTDNFDAWCDRKAAERAERAAQQPHPRRRSFSTSNMHTPCPALWAGR